MKRFLILIFTLAIITSSCTKEELKSRNGTYSGISVKDLFDSSGYIGSDTIFGVSFTVKFKSNKKIKISGRKYNYEDDKITEIDQQGHSASSGYFYGEDSLFWSGGSLSFTRLYLKRE